MKVLVTGGAGYIGSHMVRHLAAHGCDVVVYDNLSTGHDWAVPGATLETGDLRDQAYLEQFFQRHRFEAVIHFAARSLVGESRQKPLDYYENNVVGTINLARCCLEHGVKRFVFSSTAAVYGEPDSLLIPESAPLAPINPYGATKVACERMLADAGVPHVCLRYFNAAGAAPDGRLGESHEPETHLIPRLLQVASGRADGFTLYGDDYPTPDGTCIRDYVHVEDLAEAHRLALEYLDAGGLSRALNCGYGRGHSVREVIEACQRVTGVSIPIETAARREGDPPRLVADGRDLRETLDWEPRYEDLDTIIEHAWRWEQAIATPFQPGPDPVL